MKYTFKNFELSPAEKIWLKEVRDIKKPDFKRIKAKLWDDLPEDFDPKSIDPAIYRGDHITLLGIWCLNPSDPMIDIVDKAIKYIRQKILEEQIDNIEAINLAKDIDITNHQAEHALYLASDLGSFISSASSPEESKGYSHISFNGEDGYDDYLSYKGIEEQIECFFKRTRPYKGKQPSYSFTPSYKTPIASRADFDIEALLHPRIKNHSYQLFLDGHLREAVMNSITAVFDFIRERTSCAEDGDRLIGKVFSLDRPILILSELGTESGCNNQKGFMKIFQGAYLGIRNPKAHTLAHDLNPHAAAQYLVFASLLARRVEDSTLSISEDNKATP